MTSFILALLLLLASPQASPKNGTIEGTVTRFGTGDPLPDVEIVMNGKGRSTNGLTPQAITDSRGHFVIGDVPPGSYSIRAQRTGYTNPAPNGVRVLEGGATRTVTVVAVERTPNADLTMARAGGISGRMLDSSGKPFANQYGYLVSLDERGSANARTDDRGDYHIVNVPPGKYYLVSDSEPSPTYFPGVLDKAKAIVLEIDEGTVLTGVDMTVRNGASPSESDKTFNISGRAVDRDGVARSDIFQVVDLLSQVPNESATVGIYRQSGYGSSGFYFTGVHPGRYDVYLYFNDSSSFMVNRSKLGTIGRVEVSVADGDVKDIVLAPGGVSVNGQLVTTGETSKPSASVRLRMPSNSVQSRESKTGTAGEFSIPNVVSGTWKVGVSELAADQALLDVRQDDISVYDNGFPVEDRTPKPIQVLVGPGGSITGIVRNDQNAPLGAAQVLLIADIPDPSHPAVLFRKATTDGTGRFAISNVAAGSYRIYALDPSTFSAESIPDTADALSRFLIPEIRSKGVAASVASGSKLDLSLSSIH